MRAAAATVLALALLSLPAAATQPLAIQDNSFLIEEAYNQEAGVVQHIFGMTRTPDGRWSGTFTQEWPVGGLAHQLSYTLPMDRRTSESAINYRYQLAGDGEARLACSPRLSVTLGPLHDRHYGVQVMVPVSVALSDRFVTHWNAGASRERGRNTYTAGASAIWAAWPKVHVMVESIWDSSSRATLVSPGLRWAHDRPRKLQIVPGLALPVDTRNHQRSVFLYLSLEHPYR